MVYRVIGIDGNHYRVTLTTLAQTIRPSLPNEIIDDDDVALLLRREHVDPLVCIIVEQINDDHPEVKQNFHPESPHRPHDATEYDFQHTTDMPNTNAHLDDIQEGFTETANNSNSPHRHFGFHDTTEIENVSVHEFGEVAPRPVDMCIVVGELFESKQQLQSQLVKVANSDYFQIRRFDHEHTCSNEAQFPHQRQASARVIGKHIKENFRDHRLYKLKKIIQGIQKEFGISCNYHKAYRAKHIALDEVQGTPVESYRIFPSYLYMLEQTNPETITDLHTYSANRFMYMFFCLKACIVRFLSLIRPVIAIDATFLKGRHAGVLFVAVCMDGNDQIFPLAFSVGDS
ncbi:hypothetical protein Ddye_017198 [Dipteronia dyeriana]|uniref:MULE transposase domain-containing protein n=1 Tax=Dipteronia dyeriana TaxID=168575 RepID=A0AAD9WZJ9_9ROSI|nr:hypothetical protein Ddye_017198 [Dipteronia dyeriana]